MYISNVISSLLFNTVPGPEDSEYSCAAWKRVPTTLEVIFALALPYRPPESPVGAFLWRWRFWLETTIGLSLLEPWEKLLTCTSSASPSLPSSKVGVRVC